MTSARRRARPLGVALTVAAVFGMASCGAGRGTPKAPVAQPPSPASSPSPAPAPSPSPTPVAARKPLVPRYDFPVQPVSHVHFGHSHHDYPATDVFATCGDSYRAVTAGRVIGVSTKDLWRSSTDRGADRGGLSVTILGDDGVRYYGSHLRSVDPQSAVGRRVAMGQELGRVGNTGDARGIACHVHFGISPPCGTTDWFNRRGLVYPWPYLESWRAHGQNSPVSAVAAYRTAHGCPTGPTADP